MLSGLQDHSGAAQDCLGGELVGHGPGHPALDRGVCHGLDEHKDIGGGAAADRCHDIEEVFTHLLHLAEGPAQAADLFHFLRRDPLVAAGRCHALADQGRCIGHEPHKPDRIAPEALLDPGDRPSGRDADKELVRVCLVPDPENDLFQVLGLDSQKDDPGLFDDLRIVSRHTDPALAADPVPGSLREVGADDLLRLHGAGGDDAPDDRAGHVSAADKSKFHSTPFSKRRVG